MSDRAKAAPVPRHKGVWQPTTASDAYTAIIERCPDTGLYVGYVPGRQGAHSQGETLAELNANLLEVMELLEDADPLAHGNADV